jgi:hypothetical protein
MAMYSGATVFYPSNSQAATNLKNATLFTRLNILAAPTTVSTMLERTQQIQNTFCIGHYNSILVFDTEREAHTEHVRTVLQMLQDGDTKADIRGCAFSKSNWVDAGFHIEEIQNNGQVAFMVVLREHLAPDALAD